MPAAEEAVSAALEPDVLLRVIWLAETVVLHNNGLTLADLAYTLGALSFICDDSSIDLRSPP